MRRINESYLEEGATSVSTDDVDIAVSNSDSILGKFAKGPLKKFMDDGKLLLDMIGAYRRGEYRNLPWLVISAVVFALLYVLNPADIIPDFLPLVGLIDDALVLSLCLRMIETDLDRFREFRDSEQS